MARTVYEVGPRNTDWYVKRRGADRPANIYQNKQDAINRGVTLARASQPSQLIIKRRDGTIEDERTYGSDPFPPRG